MKCGKCGKNEANYYYKETVNGVTHELRLCEECARESGLDQRFVQSFGGFGFRNSFFEDFFNPFGGLMGRSFVPMMMGRLPTEQKKEATEAEQKEQNKCGSAECNAELKQRRERNMLEQQLKDAVAREDYEKAIELRDRLKEMKKD